MLANIENLSILQFGCPTKLINCKNMHFCLLEPENTTCFFVQLYLYLVNKGAAKQKGIYGHTRKVEYPFGRGQVRRVVFFERVQAASAPGWTRERL
jgi:hypothetical protein